MNTFRAMAMFAGFLLAAQNLAAQPRPGLKPDADQYGNCWAVIVGINYESTAGKSTGVPRLNFAEDDARAFHELLVKNYGFKSENTKLLLGSGGVNGVGGANKADIEKAVSSLWNSDIGENDCVLFYFSGHGYGRTVTSGTRGQLLASNATFQDGRPSAEAAIEFDWIVKMLTEESPARHKLMILDCCHSGAVLSEYGRPATNQGIGRSDSFFKDKCFQTLVASRALETAQDGKDGHSPFTDALLKSLRYMPGEQEKGSPILVTKLFEEMKLYLKDSLGRGQSPSCSYLTNHQGEFHFFPDPQSVFPRRDVPDEEIRKMMVAMVPGSFGNWWFSETPWFMPGLRYYILEADGPSRNVTPEIIAPDRLKAAAERLQQRKSGITEERYVQRMRHLNRLLNAKGEDWNTAIQEVIDELTAEAEKPTVDPLDLHYLAVLHHGAGKDRSAAKVIYDRALELYAEKAKTDKPSKALMALCYADRGWYSHDVEHDYESACDHYLKARNVYGNKETPKPFLIYVVCREADSLSKLGRTGAARARLGDAEQVLDELDPQRKFPITAAYHHRKAWIDMEWCDFESAIGNFQESTKILAENPSLEAIIMRFHNDHGEAMATRFGGDRDQAMYKYRELMQSISTKLAELREDTTNDTNFRQVRLRMVERWVNTLERLGDCSLFGQPTDAGEAADDYRRAIRATTYLPIEMRHRWEQRLRYKYALSLVLPDSPVQDLELAEEQLTIVQAMVGGDDAAQPATEMPRALAPYDVATKERDIAICRDLTRLLIAHCRVERDCPEGECEERIALKRDTQAFRAQRQAELEQTRLNPILRRDEIEAALFCIKLLIDDLPNPAEDPDPAVARQGRIVRRDDVDLLLGYCRLARPRRSMSEAPAERALTFLRPYYDTAMEALLELKPNDAKQLIEVAHEARKGRTHFKPATQEATLVLYCTAKQSYLFLDVPRATSSFFPLPPGIDATAIQAASSGRLSPINLPAEVRKELLTMSTPVRICWHDPVNKLKQSHVPHITARPIEGQPGPEVPMLPVGVAALGTVTSAGAATGFPFDLPAGINVLEEDASTRAKTEKPVATIRTEE